MDDWQTTREFVSAGRRLLVTAVNLRGGECQPEIPHGVAEVWNDLAPFLSERRHHAYVRDDVTWSVDGAYPAGFAGNGQEMTIAVPRWPTVEQPLLASFAHELHHLARWQNAGYGQTLGEALVSEGMAYWSERHFAGWTGPWWDEAVSPEVLEAARRDWDDPHYDHASWFFDGPLGRWKGYGLAAKLGRDLMGPTFDVEMSLKLGAADAFPRL